MPEKKYEEGPKLPSAKIPKHEPEREELEAPMPVAPPAPKPVAIQRCVICNKRSDEFTQPGKVINERYICPDCVLLI
jgi:hypothetical protein